MRRCAGVVDPQDVCRVAQQQLMIRLRGDAPPRWRGFNVLAHINIVACASWCVPLLDLEESCPHGKHSGVALRPRGDVRTSLSVAEWGRVCFSQAHALRVTRNGRPTRGPARGLGSASVARPGRMRGPRSHSSRARPRAAGRAPQRQSASLRSCSSVSCACPRCWT